MNSAARGRASILGIVLFSLLACAFLFWLLYFREASSPHSRSLLWLPAFNAALNASSSCCLVLGFLAIRRGARHIHRRWMILAFSFSTLFLVGYITHHTLHGDTRFVGDGAVRTIYLSVLASHVLLSIAALPMVLVTFYLSLSGQFARHRRLARYTFPIWLYVSVTGVLVFVMLNTLSEGPSTGTEHSHEPSHQPRRALLSLSASSQTEQSSRLDVVRRPFQTRVEPSERLVEVAVLKGDLAHVSVRLGKVFLGA